MSTGARRDRREWKAEFSILQPLKKQNVKIVVISISNHRFSPRVLCKYMEPNWINNSLQGEMVVFLDLDYFFVWIFFLGQGHSFSVQNFKLSMYNVEVYFSKD